MTYISTTNFDLEVAKGNVSGTEGRSIYATNADLDTAAGFQLIWNGNTAWRRMLAADTLDIIFADPNDTAAGTGAQEVTLIGLDQNGDKQTVVEASNGGTVTTTEQWTAINEIKVTAAGVNEWNEGNITVQETTSAQVQSFILATHSVSQQFTFGVPTGHTAYLEKFFFILSKALGIKPTVEVQGWKHENGVTTQLFLDEIDAEITPILEYEPNNKVKIAGGGYWWIEASTDTNNTKIRGHVEHKVIED